MKTLYPFQVKDVERMIKGNVINANDMGLGKTAEALVTTRIVEPSDVLVICPSTVKINWQREAREWLGMDAYRFLDPQIAEGDYFPDSRMVIINYDILERHLDAIRKRPMDMLIVDESHYIKTFEAKRTQHILRLLAKHKILMSGTPILNRPKELFTQLACIGAVDLSKEKMYLNRYCNPQLKWRKGKRGKFWDYSGASNIDELSKHFKKWVIRNRKVDVLKDLPKKTRQIVELDTGHNRWPIAEEFIAKLRRIKNGQTDQYKEALRRLDCEVELEFGSMSTMRLESGLRKVPLVVEHLRGCIESSRKVLCFAHHREVVEQIGQAFRGSSVLIHGGMDSGAKQRSVDTFRSDPSTQLLVGNTKSAGTGVDGLQDVCSHAVFAELDWSPGGVLQAEDRLVRIGQANNVLVQHLIESNTIDVIMAKMLVAKQELIEKVVD